VDLKRAIQRERLMLYFELLEERDPYTPDLARELT